MSDNDFLKDKELQAFICSVRRRALGDRRQDIKATGNQVTRLIIQITDPLVDKNNRKRVLSAISGYTIHTQIQFSLFYHSILIDETKDGMANGIIGRIEDIVKKYPIESAAGIFPWDRPTPNVSFLSETDLEGAYL